MGASQRQIAAKRQARARRAKPKEVSAEELMQQAQMCIEMGDYDEGKALLERAVESEPMNAEVLDAYGALLAEMGQTEGAIAALKRAAELSPESGHEKFMYLGQLMEGQEALDFVKVGVRILESKLASTSEPDEQEEAKTDLCSALCSLAELMIGGASGDLSSVEEEVTGVLKRAEHCSPSSPEPQQVLASMLYELGKADEALSSLRGSMSKWLHSAPEEEQEGWDLDAELPSYEFRFECAKLLLELDDSTEDAIEVLESLVAEDDMDPNAWHMLGLAYYSGGHLAEAEEALERGEALLGKLGVPADHELRGHYEDLKDAVQDAKAKMGEGAGAEGGDGEVMEE